MSRPLDPPRPRRLGAGVAAGVGVTLLAAAAVSAAASPPAAAADRFLMLIATRGAAAAWLSASPRFRASISQQRWVRYAQASGLARVTSSRWTNQGATTGGAFVFGTVTLARREDIPARIQLERSGGTWRVSRLDLKLKGAAFDTVQRPAIGATRPEHLDERAGH